MMIVKNLNGRVKIKMYYAKTQSLKYDYMVISKTKDGAWKQLEKWWNKTWKEEEGMSFKDAIEWHGFYLCEDKIELDEEFEIQ